MCTLILDTIRWAKVHVYTAVPVQYMYTISVDLCTQCIVVGIRELELPWERSVIRVIGEPERHQAEAGGTTGGPTLDTEAC